MIATLPQSTPDTALPPTAAGGLAPAESLAAAQAFTARLAHQHYENFSVVSALLPKAMRQDFCNIYAFCRIADDLGDELGDPARAVALLNQLHEQTLQCMAGDASSCLFVALRDTVRRYSIPAEPFLRLINAFQQDQRITRYADLPQVVDYCTRSADPVGRLVLYLCGYSDARRQELSDQICTGLQLANFWQDVRRDLLERDRIYLPANVLLRHGVTEQQIQEGRCTDGYRAAVKELVDVTAGYFSRGEALLPLIGRRYRPQIALFPGGGRAVLAAIRRQNYDTLTRRPVISRAKKMALMAGVLVRMALPGGRGKGGD